MVRSAGVLIVLAVAACAGDHGPALIAQTAAAAMAAGERSDAGEASATLASG